MDELRLILIVVGAVILLLIYLWGTRKQIKERLQAKKRLRAARLPENEPVLDDADTTAEVTDQQQQYEADAAAIVADDQADDPGEYRADYSDPAGTDREAEEIISVTAKELEQHDAPASISNRRAEPLPTMNVLMTVMAADGRFFTGADILSVCRELELILNTDKGTWECHMDSEKQDGAVFSIAHLKEPGLFELATMDNLSTPGVLMFAQLPGSAKAVAVVDLMIATAGQLARKLNGTLCDERGTKMSTQAMIHLRSEAAEFDQRQE